MALQVIVAVGISGLISSSTASEYDLGSTSWAEPSRTKWCPVHAPFSIRNSATGVTLTPPYRGSFSLAETRATLPASHATMGLRLRLSTSGSKMPSFWRVALRLSAGGDKVRFIAPIDAPSGGIEKTIFLPWTSFEGQKLRAGGVDPCDDSWQCTFDAEKLTHISVIWAREDDIEEPALTLHEVVATSSTEVQAQSFSDTQCACDANCVQCMASEWAVLVSNSCSSSSTWDMCLAVRRSLAERVAASLSGNCALPGAIDAVQWLGSTMDVSHCAQADSSLSAVVLGDVLHGVFNVLLSGTCENGKVGTSADFVGPFVGWGITAHNDLDKFESQTANSCLAKCRANERCKSIDYGARDSVRGECWLSTADRFTASDSYSNRWTKYDYYELATMSTGGTTTYAGSMANEMSTDTRTELMQGLPDEMACCGEPGKCITKAIEAGSAAYNNGNTLGCFVIYHATALRLAGCSLAGQSLPDARGLMQATAKTAEMDTHTGHGAWRLRHALDLYASMLRFSGTESLQCQQRFTPLPIGNITLSMSNANSEGGSETKKTFASSDPQDTSNEANGANQQVAASSAALRFGVLALCLPLVVILN